MGFVLDKYSELNLKGVHPDLVRLARMVAATSSVPFRVVDGVRTLAEEKINVKKGTSQTLKSYHLVQKDGFGHAVDFVVLTNNKPDWYHIALFLSIVSEFKIQSAKLEIPIDCGADWKTLKDYGHIQLDKKKYPI